MRLFMILAMCGMTFTLQAKDSYPLHPSTDIIHYGFHIELDTTTAFIKARATITLRYQKEENTLFLDLISKSDSLGMEVTSVTSNGQELLFDHENNQLMIRCPEITVADTLHKIEIQYQGQPADGLIISKNKFGHPSFFGDNWPDRARHWLPTVDHPSDKATVDFYVTAPVDLEVVANGRFVSKTPAGNGNSQTHFQSLVPLPTKVMVIGVSQFTVEQVGVTNGIPVETWVYDENYREGFTDYRPAIEIVEFFQNKIGPYAFEKLANVQSKTVYGGMENSGAIFYYENSVTGQNTMHRLLAHEIAHQWFGDAVTEQDWHHIWLSEGFATYLEAVCMEELFNAYAMPEHMSQLRKRVVTYYERKQAPVVDTTVIQLIRLLNTNSYQKGAWVLHMLRNELGEEAFWQGMRTYYQQFRNKTAMTRDFRHIMEEVSGRSLENFFDQWIFSAGHPVLSIKIDRSDAGETLITIEQQQKHIFSFPLTISLFPDNNQKDTSYTTTLPIKDQLETFTVSPGFIAESFKADPDVHLLYELKAANH